MDRVGSANSLGAFASVLQSDEDLSPKNEQGYSIKFQAMLESLAEEDTQLHDSFRATHTAEKKRRLSIDQVRALEKNFEVENKLEPERKAQLAEELGLEPRQVAVWFQNRRARWKTKMLERDYGLLKAKYDDLKAEYGNLEQENESLNAKLRELRSKLKEEDNSESSGSDKQDCSFQTAQIRDHDFSSDGAPHNPMTSPSPSSTLRFDGSSSVLFPNRFTLTGFGSGSEPHIPESREDRNSSCVSFPAEDSCCFLSVDHAPSLQWYFYTQ